VGIPQLGNLFADGGSVRDRLSWWRLAQSPIHGPWRLGVLTELGPDHGIQGTNGHTGDLAKIAAAVYDEVVDRPAWNAPLRPPR
jgi:hypothetical protein